MPARKRPATAASPWPRRLRVILPIVALCVLAGCATRQARHAYRLHTAPTHYYPPPGPPNDPWGPYIQAAAARFGVPELWIREVMRQESGGNETAVSPAGAMGLMQVIPSTYETLREQYGFGDDPFQPHDNIFAGTAYIRAMYDRFGSPGFLAAYNAGPQRLDDYLTTGDPLPDETVGYVASIAPRIAGSAPETGPLSVYDGNGAVQYAAVAGSAGACDLDAAYDPARPCAAGASAAVAVAAVPAPAPGGSMINDPGARDGVSPTQTQAAPGGVITVAALPAPGACDPDAAYDPTRPCAPRPSGGSLIYDPNATYAPAAAATPPATMAAAVPVPRAVGVGGDWAIQVGAFLNPGLARAAADHARLAAPDLLGAARLELPLTEPFGTTVLYRARLTDLTARSAGEACTRLVRRQLACMVVPPRAG